MLLHIGCELFFLAVFGMEDPEFYTHHGLKKRKTNEMVSKPAILMKLLNNAYFPSESSLFSL